MNELIKISEHNGQQVVSARDLHDFLGSKKQFGDWIAHRVKKYGLIENQDYVTFSLNGEKGRPTVEYALSLDAAKELSMVEGNARGKEARKYFIECEKELKVLAPKPMTIEEIAMVSLKGIMETKERMNTIEHKVKVLEAQTITSSVDYFTIAGYASLIGKKVDVPTAAKIGRKATTLCGTLGCFTGAVKDSRWGKVKTYPEEVLKTAFDQYYTK